MPFYGHVNVINVDTLERELANVAVYANHPAAQQWIRSVARNFILSSLSEKDSASLFMPYVPPKKGKHSDMPPVYKLPCWAQQAVNDGIELHWFDWVQAPRRPLWQCLNYIIHWFNAWENDDPRWNGERITRICWHTAAREAAMWFKDVNENLWDYVKDKPPVIKTYEHGFFWVRLNTQLHFERESRMMNHCVGSGGYYERYQRGETMYFSLRDKQNRPHCTIEVSRKGRGRDSAVLQCKGNSNHKPPPEYQPYMRRFFNDMGWEITGDHHHID